MPWENQAFSDEARRIRQLIHDATEFPDSLVVGEPTRSEQEALDAVYEEAQIDDWDGEGSARVESSTYEYARQFIRLIPPTVTRPEIAADVDGELLFEWERDPRQTFSVSVGRDGTLSYAGLFGYEKIHGTVHFREALAKVISDCLAHFSSETGA